MFSGITKIFDRNFIIGHFLPVFIYVVINYWIMQYFQIQAAPFKIFVLKGTITVDAGILAIISLLVAFVISTFNIYWIMFLEGYGKYNPLRIFDECEIRLYDKLKAEKYSLEAEISQMEQTQTNVEQDERYKRATDDYSQLCIRIVKRFPHDKAYFLPTALGNTIRSFEVYSTVMYGLEAIGGWERLLAVIPRDYMDMITAAKANLDFYVNLLFLHVLTVAAYLAVFYFKNEFYSMAIVLISSIFAYLFYRMCVLMVSEWGDLIKASFDMFISDLNGKLNYVQQKSPKEERSQWESFSRAITYRYPSALPYRKGAEQSTDDIKEKRTLSADDAD